MNKKQEELRENLIQDQHHDHLMRTNLSYFSKYIMENLYMRPRIGDKVFLHDMIQVLEKECLFYDHPLGDLLDYIKNTNKS